MGLANTIGRYQLSRTVGEGAFSKVKLAVDTKSGQYVAIKIIDKQMVIENNLISQVAREIRTMKLLHHPNIVQIYEVIGTKSKIYIVMEYVSGGPLSDKLMYTNGLNEGEARKYFQQLIDAVEYCHCIGVYHRDLKPQNLLLDNKGNVKITDFGLSAERQTGAPLSTICGSPSYVAPELLTNKEYDGAAADTWSCGVILFEMLAGYLPFDDSSLINLYKKIFKAAYTFPLWFTKSEKQLISRILTPSPYARLTISEIMEDQWFQIDYKPAVRIEAYEIINMDDVHEALSSIKGNDVKAEVPRKSSFINAFQLISMSHYLDLSGLFEEQDNGKQRTTLGSKTDVNKTLEKIEAAAEHASLLVNRMNNNKMKLHPKRKMTRCSRLCFSLSAEVIEVAPTHCIIEISKSAGELKLFEEFCTSLSRMLTDESEVHSKLQ